MAHAGPSLFADSRLRLPVPPIVVDAREWPKVFVSPPHAGAALFRLLTRQKSAKARLPLGCYPESVASVSLQSCPRPGGALLTFSAANC